MVRTQFIRNDANIDPFASFNVAASKTTKLNKKRMKPFTLRINITSLQGSAVIEDEKKDDEADVAAHPRLSFQSDILNMSIEEKMKQAEAELEDSLKFFQESHEEQNPAFGDFAKAQKQKVVDEEIKKLESEDQAGRKEIEVIIAEQLKEKQASTDKSVEKYKMKKVVEEKKDLARLQKMFSEKSASNQSKINQGIQVLKKRNSQETQRILQQHRQQVQQRQISGEIASKEWANLQQRLQAKQERQIQEFVAKGEEVKKRTEAEYRKEQTKIRQQYEKQLAEVESNRRGIYTKMYSGFQQLRQRYLKRHVHKMMKKKEALESSLQDEELPEEKREEMDLQPKGLRNGDEVALRPPSPIKTSSEGFNSSPYGKSGAAARHKHRKGTLSQIAKQLSVEIHNEGLWIAILEEKKEEKRKDPPLDPHTESDKKTFFPWGIEARDFLESIVCGEIPSMLESKDFDFGDTVAMNGGHIRCVLTDLRTSDETASAQRVESIKEQAELEVATLEKKATDLQTEYNNAENMQARFEKEEKDLVPKAKEALQDYENKKLSWQTFRTKFAKFLGPGEYSDTSGLCLGESFLMDLCF